LRFAGINLRVQSGDGGIPQLVVDDERQPAWLSVAFPPQSITEQAWSSTSPTLPAPPGHSAVAAAHSSRLVFLVTPGARIALDSATLLDWSLLTPSLSATAAVIEGNEGSARPPIGPPAETETAIELPYRLVISPDSNARWRSRAEPFSSRGRTELWHARLVLGAGAEAGELSSLQQAPLRAIWSPDYEPSGAGVVPDLVRAAMTPDDRRQLVILTSGFEGWENSPGAPSIFLIRPGSHVAGPRGRAYIPVPFQSELLVLSALGGWLRSRGNWAPPHAGPPSELSIRAQELVKTLTAAPEEPARGRLLEAGAIRGVLGGSVAPASPPEQLDLSEWVHQGSQGRDHYVRIVYEGQLFPFRHRAALIKITERKFEEVDGVVGAYLMQRKYIVVRTPVVDFAYDDRAMPLKRVRLTTLITPDLADYDQPPESPLTRFAPALLGQAPIPSPQEDPKMLWAEIPATGGGKTPFLFQCIGTDLGGNFVDFSTAMLFVSERVTDLAAVAKEYNSPTTLSDPSARSAKVPGQKLLYAEPAGGSENTRLVTEVLSFAIDSDGAAPYLEVADVRIPQVESLLGRDAATKICLYDGYIKDGIDTAGGVFAALPDSLDVPFQAQKAGGFATPNLGVTSISRDLGPLSGNLDDAVAREFKPETFFGSLDPKLFGSFKLSDLLPQASLAEQAPKLTTSSIPDGAGGAIVETRLDWTPRVTTPASQPGFVRIEADGATIDVSGLIRRPAGGAGDPSFSFTGTLANVSVEIVDAVRIDFKSFSFAASNGAKPVVNVQLQAPPMEFEKDLKFINELRDHVPPGLFGDGPSIDLIDDPLGVRAGFAVSLPPVAVGVFALKDVALGAAVTLPFVEGNPLFDFNVSRRDHPFLVAVAIFGGGGFFHLQADASGMRELEVSIEFGAAASIDIGVASGGVHVMAGIYFSLQRTGSGANVHMAATLSGYLRMGGSLSVLGLITVSVEFNLSFTYDSTKDKAYGRATLTVEVEIACFSKSIDLTVERAFGGSGDPSFADLITTPETWNEYALAFTA
jgi:hypothetical protein